MIGPGWLPRPPRLRWRTLAYTRARRRRTKREANPAPRCNHEIVIFDHGPYELPIATLHPREARTAARVLLGDLVRWCVARWDWFRPRTVPVLVAVAGMILVLLSADYLSHAHGSAPVRVDTLTIDLQVATPPASPIFE